MEIVRATKVKSMSKTSPSPTSASTKRSPRKTRSTQLLVTAWLKIPMEATNLRKRPLSRRSVNQAMKRELSRVPAPVYRYLAKWLEGKYTLDNLDQIRVKQTGPPSVSVEFNDAVNQFLDKMFLNTATPSCMIVGGKVFKP